MKMRIARQLHAQVGIVLAEIEGPGAHRIPVQGQVARLHARLIIKMLRLPGHGGEERHGQPVGELGILALDADAIAIAIHHLGTGEGDGVQVQVGSLAILPGRGGLSLDAGRQLAKVLDMFPQDPRNGRMSPGDCQPLDLIDIIRRRQLAGAGLREVRQAVDILKVSGGQVVIAVAAGGVLGKGRMGLIVAAGTDADQVLGPGDRRRRGILGQRPALGVEIGRLRQALRRQRDELVGPQQKMVLEGRLVNLGQEGVLIGAIGACRVQVLGPLLEGGIEDIGPRLPRRPGVVPGSLATAGQKDQDQQRRPATPPSGLFASPALPPVAQFR